MPVFPVVALDWCNGCNYLAAVAAQFFPRSSIIQVYGVDSQGNISPIDGSSTINNDLLTSIKWCSDCSHLIAGSQNLTGTSLFIYDFFPTATPALVLTASVQINSLYSALMFAIIVAI